MCPKLFLQVLPTASVSPRKKVSRRFLLQRAQRFSNLSPSSHATEWQHNISELSLPVLLLEEKEAENHIKNSAYLNALIPILENMVRTSPSKRDIPHTLTDREQELTKHSDKRSLTPLGSGTLTSSFSFTLHLEEIRILPTNLYRQQLCGHSCSQCYLCFQCSAPHYAVYPHTK